MKYLQMMRKVHLWVGLFLSVFLLVEAVTGLILAEPWIIGSQKPPVSPVTSSQTNGEPNKALVVKDSSDSGENKIKGNSQQIQSGFNMFLFIKMLHRGIINGQNVRWFVDITAVGIIILTVTGIYLSVPFLRARSKKSKMS